MRSFHLHLVSDSSGETVSAIARACLVQLTDVHPDQHLWWLVRTRGQAVRVLEGVREHPGVVLCTVVDPEIRSLLEQGCREAEVPFIPVLDPVMQTLGAYLQVELGREPGRQHLPDADYFRRIDAMHYAIEMDDGQGMDRLEEADVIIMGVSRTSKTPTCMYLANRGLKAANVPMVPGIGIPPEVLACKRPLMVALTRDPRSLADIRRTRLRVMNDAANADYADVERVREEVQEARRMFTRHGWPVIDVTRRSIEETAATIMQLHRNRLAKVGGV
ncbi:MAG: kinase/pyrophosphorylase [Caenispirillum bisanense]|nr:kinase/pyrophosphorylase [Caenispirillum bisanense]MCA1971797.1 kinase/pyrophosphorylase [Caenispirillum sp.]